MIPLLLCRYISALASVITFRFLAPCERPPADPREVVSAATYFVALACSDGHSGWRITICHPEWTSLGLKRHPGWPSLGNPCYESHPVTVIEQLTSALDITTGEGTAAKSGLRNPPIKNIFIGLSCGADQCGLN